MRLNRFVDAEPLARMMVDQYQALARQEPIMRIDLACSLINLGVTLDGQNRLQESRQPISEALTILDEIRQDFRDEY